MKKVWIYTLLVMLIVSCNTKKTDQEHAAVDSLADRPFPDSVVKERVGHFFWVSDFDQKNGMIMKRAGLISPDSLTVSNILGMLNSQYPEVQLGLQKISGDSIFLKINKSAYLTQQMGSSGAEAYLAEVTYNLTELPGIDYVHLDFKEGDHASPGTFSRTDFIHAKD
jgi:hypothetical protein